MTSAVARASYAVFRKIAARNAERYPELGRQFLRARILLHPHAYLSMVYFFTILGVVFGTVAGVGIILALGIGLGVQETLLALTVGATVGAIAYLFLMVYPEFRIHSRGRRIEANMPFALNFISAMAASGVIPTEIFDALARQKVYGEIAKEASWIHRDVVLLGKDIVTALMDASRRSPSRQFADFLQGTVATVTSGGDLQKYFILKAQQASDRQRRSEKAFLDNLGLMAESYVVVAAAGPLFLIVIVSVLTLVSQRGVSPIYVLNIIIFLLLPIIHGMFVQIIGGLRPEA